MKKNAIIVLIIVFAMSCLITLKGNSAQKNLNLFDEIIQVTNSKPEECGIKTAFESEEDGEQLCLEIVKKMGVEKENLKVTKQPELYSVEFKEGNLNGYVQSRKNGNKNAVVIDISNKSNKNELNSLKEIVKKSIIEKEKNPKYFQYIKSKIESNDFEESNKKIINILDKQQVENIDTVKISNGYSTVAYTKQYEVMRSDGKWLDFNFALCSYSSGNYLIIGTPIINIAY